MTSLAVVVRAQGNSAALTRALRALSPLQPDDEVVVAYDGADAQAWAAACNAAAVDPAQVHLLCATTDADTANRAVAATRAPWVLFWDATLITGPTALGGLRRSLVAAEDEATDVVPPHAALLVGTTGWRCIGEASPLAHFLAGQQKATFGCLRDGDDVPADRVPAANWAASRALLTQLGGFDAKLGAGLHVTDFARRAYAAGVPLRLCAAVAARRVGAPSIAEAVAHWRNLGHDGLALLRKHGDPHGTSRVKQRFNLFLPLLADADSLATQLGAAEQRLVATRRPHPAHIAGLQPSLTLLYAVSVLQGLLRHPDGAALWPAFAAGSDAGSQPGARPAPRRRREAPRPKGPRLAPGAPHG